MDKYAKNATEENLTIEEVISDLAVHQAWLSNHIESQRDELTTMNLVRLLSLHGQNATRLGKLLRDQRVLSGEAADSITRAMDLAFDELSIIFGKQL